MRRLMFLSVVMGLIMSAKAQVEVHKLESIPMQKQSEKIDAELLFAPTNLRNLGNYNYNPNKPKRKGNITYTPYGNITNLDFAAYYIPIERRDFNFVKLFPDSLACRFQRDLAGATYTYKQSMWASTGFVFDPYSLSFDMFLSQGLFMDYDGIKHTYYGYRLDSLYTLVDYRLPQGYNPSSPDTLRFYLNYYSAYVANHPDTANYMTLTFLGVNANALCPKIEYPASIPDKGAATAMKAPKMTIDYILSDKDSALVSPGYVALRALTVPIPDGFAVPPGAVLGVVAQYIPGYNYNLNDTLEVITWNTNLPQGQQFISQDIKKNIFSILAWDYDQFTAEYFFDKYGYNTGLMENHAMRYKNPVTTTDSSSINRSIYAPNYYLTSAFWMSLSLGDDTNMLSYDPCDYHVNTPVSIAANMQGNDLVLKTKNSYATYSWSTTSSSDNIIATPNTYWVEVIDICGNISNDTVVVEFMSDNVCQGKQYNYRGHLLTEGIHVIRTGDTICKLTLTLQASPPVPTITRNGNMFTSNSTESNQQWYWGDSLLVGATGQAYVWTNTGKYSVEVTYPNGCTAKGETVVYSVSGRVRLQDNTPIKDLILKNKGDSATVTDFGGNYIFYVDGGESISLRPDTTHYTYDPPARILSSITNNLLQNFTAKIKSDNPPIGIVDIKAGHSIRIYPNPTTNQLTIENGELTIENVEIYNMVGQLLQSKIVNLQSKIQIDISHLANGMYFLKIDNRVVKFVKE